MVNRPIASLPDDSAARSSSSTMRFVLATGSLMSLFAAASVWFGELLGG
jgi:hypothetical protein